MWPRLPGPPPRRRPPDAHVEISPRSSDSSLKIGEVHEANRKAVGRTILHFDAVESTNETAKELLESDVEEGLVACRSAQTTRPSSTSDSRSSFAVSFVDSTASKWRIVRPTALRFASCTSPIFNDESDERGDISTCASGGRLRGGGPGSLGHILAPEEAFEHHGNPHEHADVERPGDIVPGQGAADGGDQGADSDPQV